MSDPTLPQSQPGAEPVSPATTSRRTTLGVLWVAGQTYGGYLINFVVGVVLARILDPVDFGTFALAESLFVSLSMLVSWGVGNAILTRPTLEPKFLQTAFSVQLALTSALLLVALAIARLWAVTEPISATILAVFAGFHLLLVSAQMPKLLLERELRFRPASIITLLAILAESGIALTLALAGFGVWSLVGGRVANILLQTAGFWLVTPWIPRFGFDRAEAQWLFDYGKNIFVMDNLTIISARFDDLMVGLLRGKRALGFYSKSFLLGETLGQTIAPAAQTVMLPAFSRLRDDLERLSALYQNAIWALTRLMVPYTALVFGLAPELVALIFGAKWLPMVPILRVLVFYGALLPLVRVSRSVLYALGEERAAARAMIFQTVVFMPGVLVLTGLGGPVGGAVVVDVTTLLGIWWLTRHTQRYITTGVLRTALPPVVVGGVAAGAMLIAKGAWFSQMGLLPQVALASLLYMGVYVTGLGLVEGRDLVRRLRIVWGLVRPSEAA